jgi:hypothetical protein
MVVVDKVCCAACVALDKEGKEVLCLFVGRKSKHMKKEEHNNPVRPSPVLAVFFLFSLGDAMHGTGSEC